jgi:hypothetical protein
MMAWRIGRFVGIALTFLFLRIIPAREFSSGGRVYVNECMLGGDRGVYLLQVMT